MMAKLMIETGTINELMFQVLDATSSQGHPLMVAGRFFSDNLHLAWPLKTHAGCNGYAKHQRCIEGTLAVLCLLLLDAISTKNFDSWLVV